MWSLGRRGVLGGVCEVVGGGEGEGLTLEVIQSRASSSEIRWFMGMAGGGYFLRVTRVQDRWAVGSVSEPVEDELWEQPATSWKILLHAFW